MPDVKSCVSLAPLSKPELSTAYGLALQAGMCASGWFTLGQQNMLEKSLWELDVGLSHSVQSVRFHASAPAPDKVELRVEIGSLLQLMCVYTGSAPLDLHSFVPIYRRSCLVQHDEQLHVLAELSEPSKLADLCHAIMAAACLFQWFDPGLLCRLSILGSNLSAYHRLINRKGTVLHTGTMMVRFFDLQRCLLASHQEMLAKNNISHFLKMDDNMQATNQAVEGLPCSVLPEGRSVIQQQASPCASPFASVSALPSMVPPRSRSTLP